MALDLGLEQVPPDAFYRLADMLPPLRIRYTPHAPTVKQEWWLLLDVLEAFFGGAAGPGKALNVDEVIPTADGWRRMIDVKAGDVVFDAVGQQRRVVAVGPVQFRRPCMAVTFSDGERIVCDSDHEWLTMTYNERAAAIRRTDTTRERRRANRESRVSGRKSEVFTRSLVARNKSRSYGLLDPPVPTQRTATAIAGSVMHNGRVNHSVPVTAPLDLPAADLPIDPYTLGVWLGDGSSRDGSIANDPRDGAIIDEIPYASHRNARNHLVVRVHGLTKMLRAAGVLNDKHIPTAYLRASADQRLAVMQGIVDTDGHIDRRDGRVEITLTRWRLVEGVAELAASLGIRFSLIESRAKLDGRDIGPRWRIAFQTGLPVARLPRKRDAQNRGPFRAWHDHRYIVDVQPVPSVPVRCIEVEGGVYLAGRRMVPTHNSWGLLMSALQYADVPGYNALLLRSELQEFYKPKALIPVSTNWLGGLASWNGSLRQWTFESGATLSFGYLRTPSDLTQYAGTAYAFVGFDELTSFPETLYRGMFRVLRDPPPLPGGGTVPLRMRSASNPGGPGHAYVKTRFVDPTSREPGAVFVAATIHDNPHMDYDEYLESLAHLDPITRARLIEGDWDVTEEGDQFDRTRLVVVDHPPPAVKAVRYWDTAASEPSASNTDPDWTVGLRLEVNRDGLFTIRDVVRGRWPAEGVEAVVRATAEQDGPAVPVFIEQDPGAAGKIVVSHFQRTVLRGYACHAGLTRGQNKVVRAIPVAAAVNNGHVRVVRFEGLTAFMDELAIFPRGVHDDQVDALSGAHTALARAGGRARTGVPRGRIPTGASRGRSVR